MNYYLNSKEHHLQQVLLDDYAYEVGSELPYQGEIYRIEEIKIIEPNEGKIVLECKRKIVSQRKLAYSKPRERL